MLPVIALLGIGILGTTIVVTYWEDIKKWLTELVTSLSATWKKLTVFVKHTARVFANRIKDALSTITHKLYYLEEGQWMERATSAELSENELPADILAEIKSKYKPVDITKVMEKTLDLQIAG